jgi:hypothetical protein
MSETSVDFHRNRAARNHRCENLKSYILWGTCPTRRLTFNGLHGVMSQEIEIFNLWMDLPSSVGSGKLVRSRQSGPQTAAWTSISVALPLMLLHQPDKLQHGAAWLLWYKEMSVHSRKVDVAVVTKWHTCRSTRSYPGCGVFHCHYRSIL